MSLVDPKQAPMKRSDIKKEAKFRAGLILESVIAADWAGEAENVERYGQETADAVASEIAAIATRLIQSS